MRAAAERDVARTRRRAAPTSDEAIRSYLPLVRRVVQRLAVRKPPHIELDELLSWGVEGLLDAFKKYDATKRAAFTTYAQFRIRGAILDHLRAVDWVSRSVRQKASLLERTYHRLEGTLGRPATEEEVADALGMRLAQLHELLAEIGHMTLFSLEDLGLAGGADRAQLDRLLARSDTDPMQTLLSRERVALVSGALDQLPEKERTVVALYYHEGLTMREVGAVVRLTESRVSQLHAQALLRLRALLRRHFAADAALDG
jgi:RNA polymerase sigma factor FliA